ncbi:hypothetical protein [Occultella gossypii]|uniref:Uncharacterized protein n=1 Tax=Occultella gossypii TaxID=2800820 RepID=A0ABS7SE76_9MICO|nr:hypothetical protein [Occultella gossypii]MBZ2198208.1 hypothetical protein [Occultella gossypii]
MLSDRRRRKGANRTRAGDGRPIEPFRWWHQLAGRRLFALRLVKADGSRANYLVDVRVSGKQAGDLGKVHLYLDERHHAESPLPAVVPVEGGVVEVSLSSVGIRRAHFQPDGGVARQLTPHPRTAIGRRLRFDRDHPVLSRWVGVIAVGMLIVGLGVNVLQLLEPLSQIPPLAQRFGHFESPVQLPLWLNITLGFAAGLASTERALRLKYHWLLDGAGA